MTRIKTVPFDEADTNLHDLYRVIETERGSLAEIHKSLSLRPDLVDAHFKLYKNLMLSETTSLSRAERELIAVTVSLHNGSAYCAAHHGKSLEEHGGDPVHLSYHRPISSGAGGDLREQALLEFSRALALEPTHIGDDEVEKLRAVGFKDQEILEIVMIVSYFCMANRFTHALDVELERDYEKMCK